jgi:hypothetical protein
MAKRRTEITLKFTVDLDHFEGFGHTPESWIEYAKVQLSRQVPHYNPNVTVLEVDGQEQ